MEPRSHFAYKDGHHYNYAEGMSYPQGYNQGRDAGHYLSARPVTSNNIYSPALTTLSKQTEYNLNRLKQKLCKIDPCYEYGIEHWHTDQRKEEVDVAWKNEELPAHARPQWETTKNLFTTQNAMDRTNFRTKKRVDDDGSSQSENSAPVSVCYLCSTLEEHEQHLVRRGPQLKEKNVPKPRVKYFAPPPLLKKREDEVEEKKECLYKVTVLTGKLFKSGTSALVGVIIKGQRGVMQKKELTKKRANFFFGVGTSEVFYIKGPDLGDLRSLVVQHDGLEQSHAWFLEYIEVHNMTNNKCWVFMCKNWLSLYDGDYKTKRILRAQQKEMYETEYEISVITANKRLAGTDANVYITLYGKKTFTPKEKLERKGKNLFESGSQDRFTLITKELGPITSIKLEHDNSGAMAGWLVEQVIVHDVGLDQKYVFPVGQWLATDEGDGAIAKVFYPLTKKVKEKMSATNTMARNRRRPKDRYDDRDDEAQGEMIYYQVSIVTGNKSYAGTDAKVYIQFIGKGGKTHEEYLPDDNSEKFEKGKTDIFKFRAADVGELKKLHIRHDNSGLGAGWFLDKVMVRRFFSQREINSKFSKMQEEIDEHVNRRVSEISGKDIEEIEKESGRKKSLKSSGKFRRMSTLNEEEEEENQKSNRSRRLDDDSPKVQRRGSRKSRRKYSDDSDDSGFEVVNPRGKGRRVQKRYVIGVKEFILTETESDDDSSDSYDRSNRNKQKKHRRGKYDSDEDSDNDYHRKSQKKGRKGKYDSDEESDNDYHRKSQKKGRKGKYDSDEESEDDYQGKSRRKGRKGKYDSDEESDDGHRKRQGKKHRHGKTDSESDDSDDKFRRKQKENRRRNVKSDDSESDDERMRKDKRKTKSKWDRKSSDSESDSEDNKRKKKGSRGRQRYASDDSEEESFAVTKVWKKDRVPYCDEYMFPCNQWLAEDEEDEAIARTLRPDSCTTFYRMAKTKK